MNKTPYYEKFDINTSVEIRRKYDIGDIFINEIKCNHCGDIIRSENRHDYKSCSCNKISVDGGSWYAKRSFKEEKDYEERMIYYNKK